MKRALEIVIGVLAAAAISFASAGAPQKLPDEFKIFVHYEVAPPTLDDAWKAAPIIVYVRVEAVTPVERRSYDVYPGPFTEARLVVVEVFKGKDFITEPEWILRQGAGVADTPIPRRSIPLFTQSEYVLFLHRPLRDSEALAWADGGAWRLGREFVDIPTPARRMWNSRARVPREELFDALRLMRSSQAK